MIRQDQYTIDLLRLPDGVSEFTYLLSDSFFESIEKGDVTGGDVSVKVVVNKKIYAYEFAIHIEGVVYLICDRCLEKLEHEVSLNEQLIVRLGQEYAEPEDGLIVIPDNEGKIDLHWYLYEFIALSLPMQHAHAEGECNESMLLKLNEHLALSVSDDEECECEENIEEDIDPRWNELKKIINNN